MKNRIKIPSKIRSRLQKEINSKCPWCKNTEVEYFEIHHIDENPENNIEENLILVCANCHTKITRGDITETEVIKTKTTLPVVMKEIEFVSAVIDSSNCSWESYKENELAFFQNSNLYLSPFPIINFSLINHKNKTILLRKILLHAKDIPRISGLPIPRVLYSLAKYHIVIEGENNELILINSIHVPSNESFMFQVELSQRYSSSKEHL